MIGTVINNYEIIKEIGIGGMGTIYLARHKTLQYDVAIKRLHPHLTQDQNIRDRFLLEAKTLSILSHPGITKLIGFEEKDDSLFIILEYLEGLSLDKYISQKKGLIPEEEANILMKKILIALGYAHKNRIVHRDLKPSNIFIQTNGEPKILDFGIAKILGNNLNQTQTQTGSTLGSPRYMSPDQILGRDISNKSDIYTLGVLYYEMLTGQKIYDEKKYTLHEINDFITKKPLPRVKEKYKHISSIAQEIIDKATEKDSKKRFKDCEEFLSAIESKSISDDPISFDTTIIENQKLQLPEKTDENLKSQKLVSILLLTILVVFFIPLLADNYSKQEKYKSFVKSAEDYSSKGKYKLAISDYNTALQYKSSNIIEHNIKGLTYVSQGINHYIHGRYKQAFTLFRKAAKYNIKEAYFFLGELTYNGFGTTKDFNTGLFYTKRSYDLGFSMAAWRLAMSYKKGEGVTRDNQKALEYYKEAEPELKIRASIDDPIALGILGITYLDGFFEDTDFEKAYEYLSKSAKAGYAYIQPFLAQCYIKGQGVRQNIEEGIKWLTASAQKGHPPALLNLGRRFLKGDEVVKDINKGLRLIKIAADSSFSDALNALSFLYHDGKYTAKNDIQSFDYTKLALKYDQTNAAAFENLAFDYINGEGTNKNYVLAIQYLKKAFEADNSRTNILVNIASLHWSGGFGLEQDESIFEKFCIYAEKQGSVEATNLLAKYYNQKGVFQYNQGNYQNATGYFEKAIERNYQIAKNNLSINKNRIHKN